MNQLVREFLNRLEIREVKLLAWGVVYGGFNEEERSCSRPVETL